MNEQQNVELKLIHMEDVVSKEVEWLWYPYIPYGKITIIEGDPGEGKVDMHRANEIRPVLKHLGMIAEKIIVQLFLSVI